MRKDSEKHKKEHDSTGRAVSQRKAEQEAQTCSGSYSKAAFSAGLQNSHLI